MPEFYEPHPKGREREAKCCPFSVACPARSARPSDFSFDFRGAAPGTAGAGASGAFSPWPLRLADLAGLAQHIRHREGGEGRAGGYCPLLVGGIGLSLYDLAAHLENWLVLFTSGKLLLWLLLLHFLSFRVRKACHRSAAPRVARPAGAGVWSPRCSPRCSPAHLSRADALSARLSLVMHGPEVFQKTYEIFRKIVKYFRKLFLNLQAFLQYLIKVSERFGNTSCNF